MTHTPILRRERDGRLMAGRAGLSDEQAQALDLDRHLVVTAGAGSGKTRTLVRRYLRALCAAGNPVTGAEQPAGPEAIVVSTFTERAAAELRRRLRAELLVAIRELSAEHEPGDDRASNGASRAQMLRHLRSCHANFDRARVGTFHGFCASILRECAAELGIDPGFGVLQGARSRRMLESAVTSAVESAEAEVEAAARTEARDLRALFRAMGRRDLVKATQTWVESRENLGLFRTSLDDYDDEALIELWQQRYAPGRLESLENALAEGSQLSDELRSIQALAELAGAEPGAPLFAAATTALQVPAAGQDDDVVSRAERVRSFLQPFLTQGGRVRARLSAGKQGDKSALRDARELWGQVRASLVGLLGEDCEALEELPGPADRVAGPVLRGLCRLGDDAIRRYQQAKKQAHVLDFADLQLGVLELLQGNPTVRARMQARFSHFMIDEFQDTNGIQWAILRLLCDGLRHDRGLFLVGDPKQAIYRFRGGDVTLFDRAISEVREAGGAVVAFSANYRSQPALIGAFNSLFGWLMHAETPGRPTWEAPFQHLTPARGQDETIQAEGQVDLLWLGEPDDSDPEYGELPAEDLLRFVPQGAEAWAAATWLRDRHMPRASAGTSMQAAVLVRRRSHLPTYAMALRRAGVPATVVGGRGFFSRQEVHDITNLLLALAHRDDVVALLGALRGPYLALSDEWLLWLARLGRDGGTWALRTGWDQVLKGSLPDTDQPPGWAELPDAAQTDLLRSARLYLRWQRARIHLPISELVRKILDDSAGIHLFAKNDPTGQTLANVEKLVSVAADYDSLGPDSIADFALYLREQEEREAEEGDAPLDELAPVVLMTIHQSKGLEFPIVVLPDLHHPLRKGLTDPLVLGRLGQRVAGEDLWEPGIRVPVEGQRRTVEPTLLRKLVARRCRHEDIAESRRLLYVGMTRAEDRLVCIASQPSNNEPRGRDDSKSWEEWLRAWLAESKPRDVSVYEGLDPWNMTGGRPEITTQQRTGGQTLATTPSLPSDLAALLRPVPTGRTRVFSPHALSRPEPEAAHTAPPRPGKSGTAPGALRGRLRGTLVHSCLEDGITESSEALRRRVHLEATASGLWDPEERNRLVQDVENHLRGFRAAAPRQLLEEGSDVLREVPFRLPVDISGATPPDVWVEGVIDVLYRDVANQVWVVMDYKTDQRDADTLVAEYSGQVLAYGWAASQILPELRTGDWRLAADLLLTAHGACRRLFGPERPDSIEDRFTELIAGAVTVPMEHPKTP